MQEISMSSTTTATESDCYKRNLNHENYSPPINKVPQVKAPVAKVQKITYLLSEDNLV